MTIQSAKEITEVVKRLKTGDKVIVEISVDRENPSRFHLIIDEVYQLSTGWSFTYYGGITPGHEDSIYRDVYRDINPYTNLRLTYGMLSIRKISQGHEFPGPLITDYVRLRGVQS